MNRSNISLVGNTTTGQNIGSGCGIFSGKNNANNLQFKTLLAGTNITISANTTTMAICSSGGGTTPINGILYWNGSAYNPYTSAGVAKLYSGNTAPTGRTTYLNYDGNFNATNIIAKDTTTQLGDCAGYLSTNINNQTVVGACSGYLNSGYTQTTYGVFAGCCNCGSNQISIGFNSGACNIGDEQIVMGNLAGCCNTAACQLAIGYFAGISNVGVYQVAIGDRAGFRNSGGTTITIGSNAGSCNKGENLIAIGFFAGQGNTDNNKFILKQCHVNVCQLICGDFSTGEIQYRCDSWTYYGDKNTDGSWRMGLCGTCFIHAKRESGIYVIKQSISP